MRNEIIVVINCGGTIVSKPRHAHDYVDYGESRNVITAHDLEKYLPHTHDPSLVRSIDIIQRPSIGFGAEEWLTIRCEIIKALRDSTVGGVVLLHGTASLEETAYFLFMTVRANKPVIITGSQRPYGSISSDAGINYADAMRCASSPELRGVFVVMNREIHSARYVSKRDTSALEAFCSERIGRVGCVNADGRVEVSTKLADPMRLFEGRNISGVLSSRVEIVYAYAGSDGLLLNAALNCNVAGVVYAGFGPGRIASGDLPEVKKAVARGVPIFLSSRTNGGSVVLNHALCEMGVFSAGDLNPQKARVLAMLAISCYPRTAWRGLFS